MIVDRVASLWCACQSFHSTSDRNMYLSLVFLLNVKSLVKLQLEGGGKLVKGKDQQIFLLPLLHRSHLLQRGGYSLEDEEEVFEQSKNFSLPHTVVFYQGLVDT